MVAFSDGVMTSVDKVSKKKKKKKKVEKVCDRQREGDNLEGGKAICSARLEHPAVLHQV